MRSPNFPHRAEIISNVLNYRAIRSVWKRYLRDKLRSSVIADPLENLDTHVNIDIVAKNIERRISSGIYAPSQPKRMLVEKSKGLCRQVVLPHVDDALILQCLFEAFYKDIKGQAPSRNAFFEPDKGFAAKRLSDGTRYGSLKSWLNFQKKIFEFLDDHPYVVVTDIANYYDFISYDHLRHSISGTINIREPILDLLLFSLSGMLWQPDYMQRVPIGLPQIDLDAPRILAHCLLYELDNLLRSEDECEFARYMDDIDVGVRSFAAAKRIIRQIDLSLQTKQLRLNSGKTQILSADEARRYFRIRDNILLDRLLLELSSEDAVVFARGRRRLKKSFRKVVRYARRNELFDRPGNGAKVLKRILRIASKYSVRLDDGLVSDVLWKRPAIRSSAIEYMSRRGFRLLDLKELRNLLLSGHVVDDATYIGIANGLIASEMRISSRYLDGLMDLINCMNRSEYFQLYSVLWLESKVRPIEGLLASIKKSSAIWRVDRLFGRLVGGLAPRFLIERAKREDLLKDYRHVIRASLNEDAIGVMQFHEDLCFQSGAYDAVSSFLSAPNSSLPLGITHSKFLMLLSALASERISQLQKNRLLAKHERLSRDNFYGLQLARALEQ